MGMSFLAAKKICTTTSEYPSANILRIFIVTDLNLIQHCSSLNLLKLLKKIIKDFTIVLRIKLLIWHQYLSLDSKSPQIKHNRMSNIYLTLCKKMLAARKMSLPFDYKHVCRVNASFSVIPNIASHKNAHFYCSFFFFSKSQIKDRIISTWIIWSYKPIIYHSSFPFIKNSEPCIA